jgi:hypothetical protein
MVTSSTRALLREAIQSFGSGRFLAVGVVLIAAALTAVAMISETVSAEYARIADVEFRRLGGNIRLIEENAQDPGLVLSRQVCERLSRVSGVEAAGSVGEPYFRTLSAFGDRELQIFPTSPGVSQVLASIDQPHGNFDLTMSGDLVESLGFTGRDTVLLTDDGTVTSFAFTAADLEPLRVGYDHAAFATVAPTGNATTCIVAMAPAALDLAEGLTAAFGKENLVVTPALVGSDLATSGAELWEHRTTKHVWLLGTIAYALVVGIVNWTRRSYAGLYRVLGLRRGDITAIRFAESSIASLIGSALGATLAAAALWPRYSHGLPFGWVAAGLTTAGQLAACWLISPVLWGPNPIEQIKDR